MSDLLDEEYLEWLYRQVASPSLRNPRRTFWSLFKQLYNKEFVWTVPNDDNRVEDGRFLRVAFLEEWGETDAEWLGLGCSMLEMLIALAQRFSFEADGSAEEWFWHMLKNIGLDVCNDADYHRFVTVIDEATDRIIWRTYRSNGRGGLFPLRRPVDDQRHVELWYQLNSYILEMES